MDMATVCGLLLGLAIIAGTLLLGHVPLETILQPEALLIVFGGTFTALLINFSWAEIKTAIASVNKAFYEDDMTLADVVDTLCDAAVYIRAKGLLAVQPLLSHVQIPFLQKALQMVVDNQPVEHIRAQLMTELEVTYRNSLQVSKVFEAAGGFAPTMGIIGAVLGLIQVMGTLATPEKLGGGVAGAFMATLYGVGLANLILLPLAGKLKERAKQQWLVHSMVLQGILEIRNGKNPTLIREELEAYLNTGDEPARRLSTPQQEMHYSEYDEGESRYREEANYPPDELAFAYARPYTPDDRHEVY